MKYVVTGVNRLTGECEAITSPKSKEMAERLCAEMMLIRARRRVWLRPRIKPIPWKEERLRFAPYS